MDEMTRTLGVFASYCPDGSIVYEEVVVVPIGAYRYRLMKSPGLVMGIAAQDVFELAADRKVSVVRRGGNLCVQVFHSLDGSDLENELTERFRELDGCLDGKTRNELVYTIHVTVGFERIEAMLRAVIAKFPGAAWYYGNVYDLEDETTPLDWWHAWLPPRS